MNIQIGNQVKWSSAAGVLQGEVVKIKSALNAAGNYIDWFYIKTNTKHKTVVLPVTSLKMLKFQII